MKKRLRFLLCCTVARDASHVSEQVIQDCKEVFPEIDCYLSRTAGIGESTLAELEPFKGDGLIVGMRPPA